jgi:cytochrome P450
MARSIALKWVVRLFGGPFVSPRPAEDSKRKLEQMSFERSLEHTLLEYWKSIRSKTVTSEKVIQKKRDEVVASLTLGGGGVLDSLFASGLSGQEAFDNALNAMIAAFDAAQSLLFWIIVNLSKTKSGWDECQQCVLQEEVYEKDLKGLAKFKQVAAQGKMTDYSSLSYLGRAVCETVRVYPPVWTLPRTWPMESHLVDLSQSQSVCCSKVDVLTINGVEHPHEDWHPEDVKSCHIASFGLGRRSCPAGTAALCAVYHASTEVLKRVECMEYSLKWKSPVDSTMLVPTLSIGSPYCPFYHTKLRGTAECNALQD